MRKRAVMKMAVLCALIVGPPPAVAAGVAVRSKPAAARLSSAGVVSERLFGLAGLSNVGRVAPGVLRGAQPEREGYATLKRMGVRTVINLRKRSEREAVERMGMRSIEVPINTAIGINREAAERVVALMADPSNQPVFLHCRRGKDRTGALVAIYRMKVDGWALAEAEAEMQSFGFSDGFVMLKRLVRRYRASP